MSVLHLPATAPNAGALRLFGWLSRQPDLGLAVGEIDARLGFGMTQRIIAGEVRPCGVQLDDLYAVTDCSVGHRGWDSEARAWWFAPFAAVRSRGATDAFLRDMARASGLPVPSKYMRGHSPRRVAA